VTIVIGELSQRCFHRMARHLQRLIPRASLHSVRGGSHAVHIDSPSEVAARIE
jgi:pimeloyl-ACP methyl ester carboxylesterase